MLSSQVQSYERTAPIQSAGQRLRQGLSSREDVILILAQLLSRSKIPWANHLIPLSLYLFTRKMEVTDFKVGTLRKTPEKLLLSERERATWQLDWTTV